MSDKTLRDEFAMAALPGVFQVVLTQAVHKTLDTNDSEQVERICRMAYEVADVMLETREAKEA